MHESALQSFKYFKEKYLDSIISEKPIHLIEIGSYSVNSNIRSIIENDKKFKYTGLDIEEGPNVDIVLNDPYKLPYENNTIDFIVSMSTFEHTDFFWLTYLEMYPLFCTQQEFLTEYLHKKINEVRVLALGQASPASNPKSQLRCSTEKKPCVREHSHDFCGLSSLPGQKVVSPDEAR